MRACVRLCVRVCVRVCVHALARARAFVCVVVGWGRVGVGGVRKVSAAGKVVLAPVGFIKDKHSSFPKRKALESPIICAVSQL